MNYQHDTIDRVRSIMAPANPAPSSNALGSAADRDGRETLSRVLAQLPEDAVSARRVGRRRPDYRRVRRVAAPVAAAVAVAGVAAGLTLVAQPQKAPVHPPVAGAPADADRGMPGYYVTLSYVTPPDQSSQVFATVHDSQTGRVLSQVRVPGLPGVYPNIVADGSDRSYVIAATVPAATVQSPSSKVVPALYRLRVSADGRSDSLTRLPVKVGPLGRDDVLTSMAVSPDGGELALALEISDSYTDLSMRGEIVLYSLTGGPTRTWTAPRDQPALPDDLNWISKSHLAFVWQDQLKGSETYFFTGGSQIRVLDTSAPGHDLLASRVLLTAGKLGFIQSAKVGPNGSPINVATFRVTSIGHSGTATMLLAQVSPNGTVLRTFATNTRSYSGLRSEGAVTTPCQVIATDATGQHTLAACPAFGRIDNGTFTPLAPGSGDYWAAW
jgi:hypothetical protein